MKEAVWWRRDKGLFGCWRGGRCVGECAADRCVAEVIDHYILLIECFSSFLVVWSLHFSGLGWIFALEGRGLLVFVFGVFCV